MHDRWTLSRKSRIMPSEFNMCGHGLCSRVGSADICGLEHFNQQIRVSVCHMTSSNICSLFAAADTVHSYLRKNDARAAIWLHGHDTLVEKYDAITLVWTEMRRQMRIDNDVDNWQTSNIVLPLTHSSMYHRITIAIHIRFGSASPKVHYFEACVPKLVYKLAEACYISVTGTNLNHKP